MATWIIKSQTEDFNRALELVRGQQASGYNAWIEDEYGRKLGDEGLPESYSKPAKVTAYERWMAVLFFAVTVVIALGGLYILGLWVDRDL